MSTLQEYIEELTAEYGDKVKGGFVLVLMAIFRFGCANQSRTKKNCHLRIGIMKVDVELMNRFMKILQTF